jgi:hypothetical protein
MVSLQGDPYFEVNEQMKLNDKKRDIVSAIVENFGSVVTRKQVLAYVKANGRSIADVRFIFNTKSLRAGRGQYDLSSLLTNGVDKTAKTENTSVVGTPTVSA